MDLSLKQSKNISYTNKRDIANNVYLREENLKKGLVSKAKNLVDGSKIGSSDSTQIGNVVRGQRMERLDISEMNASHLNVGILRRTHELSNDNQENSIEMLKKLDVY